MFGTPTHIRTVILRSQDGLLTSLAEQMPRVLAASLLLTLMGCSSNPAPMGAPGAANSLNAVDISPDHSGLADADGASGGRVNGLARAPNSDSIFYAASEWGGLYKSTDTGHTWSRLQNHAPSATWRVKVDPSDTNVVYATSFYDGKVRSGSGINVSKDGGQSWTNPATATPPENFCQDSVRRSEPSAFGMAADGQNIYVGTNCGLAISADHGGTWHYVNPKVRSNGRDANDVWDVVVHHNGIIDVCGDDGHRRSTDHGQTWSGTNLLPTGMCSLAVSPIESYVVFVFIGNSLYESDDSGKTWHSTQTPNYQGRIPFVVTSPPTGSAFNLWFGDVGLYRAACTAPAKPKEGQGASRCPPASSWQGSFTRPAGAHDDAGDLVFASNGCPYMFASDGGIYINTLTSAPACVTPKWRQPDITPHALWVYAMDSAPQATGQAQSLYLSAQDDGTFGSIDARVAHPAWLNADCCDSFNVVASQQRVLYTACCYSPGRQNLLFWRLSGLKGGAEVTAYPDGTIPGWNRHLIAQYGTNSYALVTTAGVFVTEDIEATTVQWTQLGASTSPGGICGIEAAVSNNRPVFYVQTDRCDGSGVRVTNGVLRDASQLFRLDGTAPGSQWSRVSLPDSAGGVGVFAVDPKNPDRLMASYIRSNGDVHVLRSANGGAQWTANTAMDDLMTGKGAFRYKTDMGPTDFTGFNGYPQTTLLSFDPEDSQNLIAGGADCGVFLSLDDGGTWRPILDATGGAIGRAQFARFDHGSAGKLLLYVGSQGRGALRVELPAKHL